MHIKQFSAIILSIFFLLPCSLMSQESRDIATVKSILLRQQNDWNKGDIDAFMNGYWESDNLKFVGATAVSYTHLTLPTKA